MASATGKRKVPLIVDTMGGTYLQPEIDYWHEQRRFVIESRIPSNKRYAQEYCRTHDDVPEL